MISLDVIPVAGCCHFDSGVNDSTVAETVLDGKTAKIAEVDPDVLPRWDREGAVACNHIFNELLNADVSGPIDIGRNRRN
jgi:hypothetical protein